MRGHVLTKLSDIFQSKAQVKVLEYLLENRKRVFNQSTLARFLEVSPSTIARIIEPLIKEKILLYERFQQGMKILCLNEEDEKTKILIEFYEKMRNL